MVSFLRKLRAPILLLVVFTIALSLDPLRGQAEEACYSSITLVKRHVHHSAATLRAWHQYHLTHPHASTSPMARSQALGHFNKACGPLAPLASETTLDLTGDDGPVLQLPMFEVVVEDPGQSILDAENLGDDTSSEADPGTSGYGVGYPAVTAFNTGAAVPATPTLPTPEPSPWVLLGTGLIGITQCSAKYKA